MRKLRRVRSVSDRGKPNSYDQLVIFIIKLSKFLNSLLLRNRALEKWHYLSEKSGLIGAKNRCELEGKEARSNRTLFGQLFT